MRDEISELCYFRITTRKLRKLRVINEYNPTAWKIKNSKIIIQKTFSFDELPSTSIIVTFYNEGLSTLLRTIFSILHTSPKKLLREIILIDDFSDLEKYPDLGKPLEDEVEKLKIVKFIRSSERKGLVRARLLGAKLATGKVLTFLDCHIECNEGKI